MNTQEKIKKFYNGHKALTKRGFCDYLKKDDIDKFYDAHRRMLLEKNKRYGDSALHNLGVFAKGGEENSIGVRLDDKLGRIKKSVTLKKNDVSDVCGYLVLYCINKGWLEFCDEKPFYGTDIKTEIEDCIFFKSADCDFSCYCIDILLKLIKEDKTPKKSNVTVLLSYLAYLCIQNDWLDFDDQID